MKNYIFCLVGNTRIVFFSSSRQELKVFYTHLVRNDVHDMCQYIQFLLKDYFLYVASVCSDITSLLRTKWESDNKMMIVDKKHVSLRSQYQDNLGLDRFLLVWYLSLREDNFSVFDLGTAWTFDLFREGCHMGGQIIIGLSSSVKSLSSCCPDLPSFSIDKLSLFQMKDCAQSTLQGLQMGMASLYRSWLDFHLISFQKENLSVYVTGGDSVFWSEWFNCGRVNKDLLKEAFVSYVQTYY